MSQVTVSTSAAGEQPRGLRRVLTLKDLIFYGLVLIQPIAPVGILGFCQIITHGHAVDTILIGMVAMMLTAFSYGRLATVYSSAGSGYTYVGRELNVHLGFLVGWAMTLDYLMFPLINTVFGSLTLHRLLPTVPYVVWVSLFVGTITFLNLRGIRAVAKADTLLLGVMTFVVLMFVIMAIHYMAHTQGWGSLFNLSVFYDPRTFDIVSVSRGTSLAVLAYIGFDCVTTLSEEVHDAKRTVPLATVLICLLTGIYSAVEIYLGMIVWPDYRSFPNLEMAFLEVTSRVGGPILLAAMGGVFIVACLGSGLTGQVGVARLLYSMGRDNVIPRRLFGHLDERHRNPTYNIWITGGLTFILALLLSYERTAELLNFGAFIGYMGVNLAAIKRFHPRAGDALLPALLGGVLVPGLGFVFCLVIWWGLAAPAKIIGGIWLGLGIIYCAVKTHGFRTAPRALDFTEI